MSHMEKLNVMNALDKCAAECNHCAIACLDEQDTKMLSRCIKLDLDCAAICKLTAEFIARSSEHAQHLREECAEICTACAEECEKHAQHMEHCKRCAEACRACAEVCKAA